MSVHGPHALLRAAPVAHPVALSALAGRAAQLLKSRSAADGTPETISVFEATTGGLVNVALQSVPGALRYYHGGANVYGRIGYKLYPEALRRELAQGTGRGGEPITLASFGEQPLCSQRFPLRSFLSPPSHVLVVPISRVNSSISQCYITF